MNVLCKVMSCFVMATSYPINILQQTASIQQTGQTGFGGWTFAITAALFSFTLLECQKE